MPPLDLDALAIILRANRGRLSQEDKGKLFDALDELAEARRRLQMQDDQAARDARLRQGVEQLRDAMRFNIRTVYLTQDLEAKLTALLAETETP